MTGERDQQEALGVSLFTGAGIGDLGLQAAGFKFVAMCEAESDRAELAAINFPEAKMFVGDIGEKSLELIGHVKRVCELRDVELSLISCTAPCQGMSKSGRGTLLRNMREGRRPEMDPRNQLILPALDVILATRPRFVVFENVSEMRDTLIPHRNGGLVFILDVIRQSLPPEYVGEAYNVEFADYGIPQRRQRLITVYTRDPVAAERFSSGIPAVPPPSHSNDGRIGKKAWVRARDILARFPPLDSRARETARDESLPFHRVPVLDAKKYEWIRHTPPGKSAFDNQCANPDCGFDGNPIHGARRNERGVNQSIKTTPVFCRRCGQLLPRPYSVGKDGKLRIMSGYTSAYKRMDPDLPVPTLTRNMSFPCSDNKIHPFQNRVLSLAEVFAVHSLDSYEYRWGPTTSTGGRVRDVAADSLIRLVVGESIPPAFMELLGRHLLALSSPELDGSLGVAQKRLEAFAG